MPKHIEGNIRAISVTSDSPDIKIEIPDHIVNIVSDNINVKMALNSTIYNEEISISLRMFLIAEILLAYNTQSRITQDQLMSFVKNVKKFKSSALGVL